MTHQQDQTIAGLPPIVTCEVCEEEFRQMLAGPRICPACMDSEEYRLTFGPEPVPGFSHEAYLKTLAPRAPLRYRVPAYCAVCEEPILPPAANHGLRFCPECRATPEYRELIGA